MNTETIERWAEDVLTVCVVSKEGAEHDLWVLLHHLFSAVKIYDNMERADKGKVAEVIKIAKRMFASKFSLREKRVRSPRKEKFPPHPLIKENLPLSPQQERKPTPAARNFSDSLHERREAFRQECYKFLDKHDVKQVTDFFYYWAEESAKKGKMLWEMERSWNTGYRLARWVNNEIANVKTAASVRLRKAKQRAGEEKAVTEEQVAAARQRIIENERREQEREEAKKNAVSYEEYLAMKNGEKL